MAIYSVTNAAQLQTVLGQAVGGDRIVLSPGNYGSVWISGRSYSSPVTIQTSTPSNRAHFDGLFISKSNNLTISGLDLGRSLNAGEAQNTAHLNTVRDSSNIRFSGVQIHGSQDGNPGNDGAGLTVTGVTNFRIDNSTFTDLFRGLNLSRTNGATVLSNSFDTIRSDGMTVSSTDRITIDRNSFTDFRPAYGDHADAIQFWNTGQTVGSSNIVIRNNVIAPGGDDVAVQGVWISDPGTLSYKNVQIANNLVYTHGAYHGISVAGGTDVRMTDNTVVSRSGDKETAWIRAVDSNNVLLQNNVTDDILISNVTGLTEVNNKDMSVDWTVRSLIPNLDTPSTLMELIVPGVGFQAPTTSAALNTLKSSAADYLGDFPVVSQGLEWQLNSFTALP